MSQVLFRGMRLLDPRRDEPRDGHEVLVGLFQDQGAHLPVMMQAGRFHRQLLA